MTAPAPLYDPDEEPPPVGPMSFEEYLAFEEAAEVRHEYIRGYAYAMSPVRSVHSLLTMNLAGRLWTITRGTSCTTWDQAMQLRAPNGDVFYPDLMVACGPRPPLDEVFLSDPCLAIEVLSPSTRRRDHGVKRETYQELASLGAYLIVESTWRAVHRHWRGDDGAWRTELVTGAGATPLPCPAGAVLTLDEVYEGVDLPAEPPVFLSSRAQRGISPSTV